MRPALPLANGDLPWHSLLSVPARGDVSLIYGSEFLGFSILPQSRRPLEPEGLQEQIWLQIAEFKS